MDKKTNQTAGSASGMFYGSIPVNTQTVQYGNISTQNSENKRYREIRNRRDYYFYKFKNSSKENTLNFKLEPEIPKPNDMVKIADDNVEPNLITKDEYDRTSERETNTGCIIS